MLNLKYKFHHNEKLDKVLIVSLRAVDCESKLETESWSYGEEQDSIGHTFLYQSSSFSQFPSPERYIFEDRKWRNNDSQRRTLKWENGWIWNQEYKGHYVIWYKAK